MIITEKFVFYFCLIFLLIGCLVKSKGITRIWIAFSFSPFLHLIIRELFNSEIGLFFFVISSPGYLLGSIGAALFSDLFKFELYKNEIFMMGYCVGIFAPGYIFLKASEYWLSRKERSE